METCSICSGKYYYKKENGKVSECWPCKIEASALHKLGKDWASVKPKYNEQLIELLAERKNVNLIIDFLKFIPYLGGLVRKLSIDSTVVVTDTSKIQNTFYQNGERFYEMQNAIMTASWLVISLDDCPNYSRVDESLQYVLKDRVIYGRPTWIINPYDTNAGVRFSASPEMTNILKGMHTFRFKGFKEKSAEDSSEESSVIKSITW